jgi:hypothetical protein
VHRLRIRQHDDRFARTGRERPFDRLRHVDLACPLLGPDRVAVQRVDHRIAALALPRISGRKENEDVAIDRVAFEISGERSPVDLDPFERRGPRARDDGWHLRRQLRGGRLRQQNGCQNRDREPQRVRHRRSSEM